MMAVEFLPAAEHELLREIAYYNEVRPELAQRFQTAVQRALIRAASRPLTGAPSFGGTRGVRVKAFPFTVVYRPGADVLVVVAISAHRRRPNYWIARVK